MLFMGFISAGAMRLGLLRLTRLEKKLLDKMLGIAMLGVEKRTCRHGRVLVPLVQLVSSVQE